jgi:hypothetical protein
MDRRRIHTRLVLLGAILVIAAGCGDARTRGAQSGRMTGGEIELSPRVRPAQAWTGQRLFVFGGEVSSTAIPTLLNDGALVDPATGDAEPLASSPFDPPLGYPRAIAGAGRVLVVGYSCAIPANFDPETTNLPCDPGTYAAATYDVSKRQWHSVEIPPELTGFTRAGPDNVTIRALGATTDGRAVLALGDFFSPQLWTVELATGEWSHLDGPPVQPVDACMSNDELFVLTTKYKNGDTLLERDPTLTPVPGQVYSGYEGDGHVLPSLAILDLQGEVSWRETPADEGVNLGQSSPYLSCLDDAAMVVDAIFGPGNVRLYTDASATWSIPAPLGARIFSLVRIWTGTDLVFLPSEADAGDPGFAYRVADDCWRSLENVPPVTRGAIWTGSAIVGYAEPLPSVSGPSFEPGPYHYEPPNTPCLPADGGAALPQASAAQPVAATPRFTE